VGNSVYWLTWTELSFHKNDIRKQKRTAGSERVRRNLRYTKAKKSARLVARSFHRWEDGKAGGRLIKNLYCKVNFFMCKSGIHKCNWDIERYWE
jgi:hypothetical protein